MAHTLQLPPSALPAAAHALAARPARPTRREALTDEERAAIAAGPWFASLSPTLRHDILRLSTPRRYEHGELIAAQGAPADSWLAVARGTLRLGTTTESGRSFTLAYLGAGAWFGDVGLFDGGLRTHEAVAHGATTVLVLSREALTGILAQHTELYGALLRLNAWRFRQLADLTESLATLPLRARLAKQLRLLARAYGAPDAAGSGEIRIGLQLSQVELAQLLGASRQRLNRELKAMEREGLVRIEPEGLVVRDIAALMPYAREAAR